MAEKQGQTDWQGESSSIEETMAIGQAIGRCARAGDLVALVGELGAGKTQLVRGLARGLGLDERVVASPTFVMIQEHEPPPPEETPLANGGAGDSMGPWLVHVDAYRIQSLQELESVGWDPSTLLAGGELREKAVLAVEWADRLGELLGEDYLRVELKHEGQEQRLLTVRAVGNWRSRLGPLKRELSAARGQPFDDPAANDIQPTAESPVSRCPICGAKVDLKQKTYPFCSERCKMADLGRWLDGRYVISRPIEQKDLEEE
ncbi:MAG: tRNA (adenosine(37)-N6)-threonylcarbamoyltransferase complex ATPase subunit type 1 TsaE [Phycisphaeraceae bacterium]|nr:tRNA (adenosine(37)-N6)-threonylcarbamoyltransferase complex ATPase subunit type 1 TsaE [Phycisphaeraceae bacterium]